MHQIKREGIHRFSFKSSFRGHKWLSLSFTRANCSQKEKKTFCFSGTSEINLRSFFLALITSIWSICLIHKGGKAHFFFKSSFWGLWEDGYRRLQYPYSVKISIWAKINYTVILCIVLDNFWLKWIWLSLWTQIMRKKIEK